MRRHTTKSLFDGGKNISQIIRSAVTTKADIENLCRKLNLDVHIDWIDNFNPNIKNQILNIDADHIGGSHWVAIYNNEWYFDPLGLPVAREALDYLNYTFLPIQDWHHGACGLYCCLYLYYANHDDIDGFYSLF